MLAKAQIIGRVGSEPMEKSDGFIPLTVAVSRKVKDEFKTTWIDVLCFKYKAEYVKKYISKGDLIYVSGNLEVNEYNGKQKPVILVEDIKNLSGKKKEEIKQMSLDHNFGPTPIGLDEVPF